jgi:hypothetical protein
MVCGASVFEDLENGLTFKLFASLRPEHHGAVRTDLSRDPESFRRHGVQMPTTQNEVVLRELNWLQGSCSGRF